MGKVMDLNTGKQNEEKRQKTPDLKTFPTEKDLGIKLKGKE